MPPAMPNLVGFSTPHNKVAGLALWLGLLVGVVLLLMLLMTSPAGSEAGGSVESISAEVSCDDLVWVPPARLTCEAAINAAVRAASRSGAQIRTAMFRYQPLCYPMGHCAPVLSDRGVVIVNLGSSNPLAIPVYLRGNTVIAEAPEPYSIGS